MTASRLPRVLVAVGALASPWLVSCAPEGCLNPFDESCVVPSPCGALGFSCDGGSSSIRVLESASEVGAGIAALAAAGDWVLENDQVVAVIDGLEHPHYLAPTGGGLLDLSHRGQDNDSLRHVFQAVGLLPAETARYTSAEIIEEGDIKALQLRGTLDGYEDVHIATRYEIRPCEPGIRVRTELTSLDEEAQTWFLADAWYYGGRELLPFTPAPGRGFSHPSFGLSTIGDVPVQVPFLVSAVHSEPAASYVTLSCNEETTWGFFSDNVSAAGAGNRILQPRDSIVYERFIGLTEGNDVAPAVDLGLELRRQLFDETFQELTGRVEVDGASGGSLGEGLRASVLIEAGGLSQDPAERTPLTHVIPAADGTFRVQVPPAERYLLTVEAYGQQVGQEEITGLDAGTLQIPAVGSLDITATVDGGETEVLVYVYPSDEETRAATEQRMYGQFEACAPLLGNPWGPSPACNRALIRGTGSFAIPPGTYDIYAVHGLDSNLALAEDVVVTAGGISPVSLTLQTLAGVMPEQALSADFHVHGGHSFDSNFPDIDRVRSFLAANIDVIAATEHDTVFDFAEAIAAVPGAAERIELLVGTETTGHVLFDLTEQAAFPQVIGHWIAWPLNYDPNAPWRGSPWDELVLPGELFARFREAGWSPEEGVMQLNHPIEEALFARDQGWATALDIDGSQPLKTAFDGELDSLFMATPEGSSFGNGDFHVQEVMNSTSNHNFHAYRAFWHYLLNNGVLRGGTANSDSHTLGGQVLGFPRNLVWSETDRASFDQTVFNRAVREGRMIGTNGPVIRATVGPAGGEDGAGPSLVPFSPGADDHLIIDVRAAPWVPVDEVRIIVNGEVVRTLDELSRPSAPTATDGTERGSFSIPLSELLPAEGDAWITIEAGQQLEPQADLDCDSFPDTGDNNRDGNIDWRDAEGQEEDPGRECYETVGPMAEPVFETDSPAWHFARAVPESYALAFTNPFVLDRNGDGSFTGSMQ